MLSNISKKQSMAQNLTTRSKKVSRKHSTELGKNAIKYLSETVYGTDTLQHSQKRWERSTQQSWVKMLSNISKKQSMAQTLDNTIKEGEEETLNKAG